MRITSLIENRPATQHSELEAEFGLSLHVECGQGRILFDTGSSGAFVRNALRMGVDLSAVDLAVLSHHHFDHGGGLAAFIEENGRAPIFLKRPVVGEPYARLFGLVSRSVGIDRSLLSKHADRFVFVDHAIEVAAGVRLLPEIRRAHPGPVGNRHLYLRKPTGWERDSFDHELILAVEEEDGVVVFTGCSHSGILNMIETVAEHLPGRTIKGVVGGFHLMGLPPLGVPGPSKREIAGLGKAMLELTAARYYTGHCTGRRAYRVLEQVMGERLAPITTGTRLEV
jgi:7,8-dihydropterin-6-yl-methyl-4-(beta-D-ribofuranosyl)aminobenzene 5'-phosphate synthase